MIRFNYLFSVYIIELLFIVTYNMFGPIKAVSNGCYWEQWYNFFLAFSQSLDTTKYTAELIWPNMTLLLR